MIGKFLFGAFVGGVTVAGGLVAASLINPVMRGKPDAAHVAAQPVKKVITATDASNPQPEPAAAPAKVAVPVDPKAPVAASESVPEAAATAAEASANDPTAVATAKDGAITGQGPEAGIVAADAAKQAPASEPATSVEEAPVDAAPMVPPMTKTAPPLAPEPIDTDLVASTVTEIPLPDQPRYPAQPPIPDQDTIIASMENPAPLPPKAATAGIAEADPAPEASAAAAVVPAPEVNPDAGAMPPPKTEPEVVLVQPDTAPDLAPESAPEVRTAQQPADDAPVKPPTPPVILPKPEIAALPDAQDPPGSTLPPAPGFRGSAEGVIVGRLPRIGDAPASEPPPAADPAAADPPDTRPRVVHAAAFDNPGAKPLFAVVLIDDGASTLDRVALASLPFPVSFALDPLDPATPDRAAIYRAAGKEVVMLATGIVEGAQASDVEVAFEAMGRGLPEAVAVMDLPEMRFQDNRPLASLVVPVVAAQGRGLLTWDQGLNAADQVARREDLAAAVIFRPIDGAGEDRTAIRRGLDRAAFKSAQDGRVTVVGRTTDETVAALLEWTVEGRAATVALAPLSAVLAID